MATPPDREDLLELLRTTTPVDFHEPIEADPRGSFRLFEALAQIFAVTAAKANRSAQACFHLGHATQSDVPASSRAYAEADLVIDRGEALDQGRLVEAGAMRFRGLGNRTYENTTTIEWIPSDPTPSKTVRIRCEFPGFAGNLDHVADDSGKLTRQSGDPDIGSLDFEDQSQNRTGTLGGITASPPGGNSSIVDSGIGERFTAVDVGLYLRVDDHPDAANVGRVVRIVGFTEGTADPITGLARHAVEIDDGPQRRILSSAQAEDGGVFTDETAEANDVTANDVTLLPAVPAVNDAYNVGAGVRFGKVTIVIGQAGVGTWTLVGEYWNGATWALLPDVVDGSLGLMASGAVDVSWTIPGNWAQNTINSVTAYHVRLRVSSFTSITQQPLGTQVWAYAGDRLVNTGGTDGDTTWSILDWSDLGFRILDIEAPSGGRDDDLYILGEERGLFQQSDEPDDEFRERVARLADTVSPAAIQRAVNRALAGLGFRGEAIDVQNGVTGFFLDVDAFDYYDDPSDAYPTDPWKLLLSAQESFGWFLVVVPWMGFGDFGLFFDEGPVLFLEESSEYTGPAFDAGFYDGAPLLAEAAYRSLYETVDTIRAGFIGFTMIRDDRLNDPACP